MSLTEGFKHKTSVAVRYHDLDSFGHVNNARYLNYLEEARLQYALDVCNWDGNIQDLGLIVANVTIDYKRPIFLGDTLDVYTRTTRLGNKSFDLAYLMIVTPPDGKALVSAEAKTTMVTYNYQEQKTVPIFTAWREAMLAYEPDLIG